MSLDVDLVATRTVTVFNANVTHNLVQMADNAGLYKPIWRPSESGFKWARDLIDPLEQGLKNLKNNPDFYRRWNPKNGWGSYETLVEFVEAYLCACRKNPDAEIETCG